MSLLKRFALVLVLALGLGCKDTLYRGDFRVLSALGVPKQYEIVAPAVVGRACWGVSGIVIVNLTFGWFGQRGNFAEAAMEDALRQAPGANALGSVEIWVTPRCYEVRGAALRIGPSN